MPFAFRTTTQDAAARATPLRLLGVWHLVCAVVALGTVAPDLPRAIGHPVGWMTLTLVAVTALIGCALLAGQASVLRAAAVLHGAQVLAVSLPGALTWIVRVGLQLSLSVPGTPQHGWIRVRHDTTAFTIWGAGAQLPLGMSVNLLALIAFAVCLTLLPDQERKRRPG